MFLCNDGIMDYDFDGIISRRGKALEITKEQENALRGNFAAKELLAAGVLSIVDEVPVKYKSDAEQVAEKSSENAELRTQIEKLRQEVQNLTELNEAYSVYITSNGGELPKLAGKKK